MLVEISPETKFNTRFCFELVAPLQPGGSATFVLVAENGAKLQEWMNALRRAMLRIRREKSKVSVVARWGEVTRAKSVFFLARSNPPNTLLGRPKTRKPPKTARWRRAMW